MLVLNFLVDLNPKNELHALFFTFLTFGKKQTSCQKNFQNDVIFENPQQQNQHLVRHAIAYLGVTRELNLGKKDALSKSAASVKNVLTVQMHHVPQPHPKVHARHTMTAEEIRHFATMVCAIPVINVNFALTELTTPVALAVPPRMDTLAIRVRPGAGEMDKTGSKNVVGMRALAALNATNCVSILKPNILSVTIRTKGIRHVIHRNGI